MTPKASRLLLGDNMYYQRNKSKYGNNKTVFGDRLYGSKLEAFYAKQLDTLKKGKAIKDFTPQFKLSLDVNGYHIANYYVDFMVENNDGSKELWEIKGFETDVWRFKWKLTEAIYGEEYKLVVYK